MTDFDSAVRWLLDSSDDLIVTLDQTGDDASRMAAARLRVSVVGPLQQTVDMKEASRDNGKPEVETEPSGSVRAIPKDQDSTVQLAGRLRE